MTIDRPDLIPPHDVSRDDRRHGIHGDRDGAARLPRAERGRGRRASRALRRRARRDVPAAAARRCRRGSRRTSALSTARSRCSRRPAAGSCCSPTWRRLSGHALRAARSGGSATGWDGETVDRAAARLQLATDMRARSAGSTSPSIRMRRRTSSRESETTAILERTDIGLCVDTGHTIVGGGDPVAFARRHAARLAPRASEGRRRRACSRRLARGRGRHGRGVAARDLLRVRRGRRADRRSSSPCRRCARSTAMA